MVSAEDVIRIYRDLKTHGIQVWLTGGWGIDALLGKQTRSYKDLDVIMLLDDVLRLCELLGRDGYSLKEIWSENRWVTDVHENKILTAFVLHDSDGREFDAHAMRLDDKGDGIPAWEAEGLIVKKNDLGGVGTITGYAIQCLSAESQMSCHSGYELPDAQMRDLMLLHEKFGVDYPEGYSNFR